MTGNPVTRLFPDTHPGIEKKLIEIEREMSFEDKLVCIRQMNMMMRQLALQGLRERYPDATEAEIQRRLMGMILGEELAAKAYGPLPSKREPADG